MVDNTTVRGNFVRCDGLAPRLTVEMMSETAECGSCPIRMMQYTRLSVCLLSVCLSVDWIVCLSDRLGKEKFVLSFGRVGLPEKVVHRRSGEARLVSVRIRTSH